LGFIWAVTSDRVLEASLGYFLNPLVSVVLGVTVLGERLRRGQWFAVALAGLGVAVLSIDLGSLPWISLFLAITFGLYGLVRKTAPVESLDGLTIEVAAMAPLAAIALGVFTADGAGAATVAGIGGWIWVAGASLMTAAPLLLFGWAARRIELWLVGVLQYITPTLQFLLGVLAYDETWSGGQVVGYVVIWIGLALFGAEGVRNRSRVSRR
jgi:chloramphenicol-sensitive protein RarD